MRGTTHDFDISLPNVDFTNIAELWVDFAQYGTVKIHKTLSDVTIDGQTVKVHLSQEDTLSLRKGKVYIQCRFLTTDGEATKTDIIRKDVDDVLKDGVIGGDTE